MKIEGREISTDQNYLDPVTYIPNHANPVLTTWFGGNDDPS